MDVKGYIKKIGQTAYFLGDIIDIKPCVSGEMAGKVTNIKLASKYFNPTSRQVEEIINDISFWNEEERIVEGKLIRARSLSDQIQKSQVGDRVFLKCFVMNTGKVKGEQIGYSRSCFPIKEKYEGKEKRSNLIYGKVKYINRDDKGRFKFVVPCNILTEGKYESVLLRLTADSSPEHGNMAARAGKCIREEAMILLGASEITSYTYVKDGETKTLYSAWLNWFNMV